MALIHCPECGKDMSKAAALCPGCGAPVVAAAAETDAAEATQATGKKLRIQQLIAVLLVIIGPLMILIGGSNPNIHQGSGAAMFGLLALLIGLIWLIVVRIRIWQRRS